ncbi:MAG: hypothetical protein QW514_05875 [Thermoprotei archaeon]
MVPVEVDVVLGDLVKITPTATTMITTTISATSTVFVDAPFMEFAPIVLIFANPLGETCSLKFKSSVNLYNPSVLTIIAIYYPGLTDVIKNTITTLL